MRRGSGIGAWLGLCFWGAAAAAAGAGDPGQDPRVAALGREVRAKGWIAYGARSDNGTWDLFLSRPDGSARRKLTDTPDFEEGAPRFSPDGTRLLFRRSPKGTAISHDSWGLQGSLMIANADGSDAASIGEDKQYPWAVWSPDGHEIACLSLKGIEIIDLADKRVVRRLPRKGMYQQMFWSPDGKWF